MDEGHALGLQPGGAQTGHQIGHPLRPKHAHEPPAVLEQPPRRRAEIANVSGHLVPGQILGVALVAYPHTGGHVGRVGGHKIHLSPDVLGTDVPHVGMDRRYTPVHAVEGGVASNEIAKIGLYLDSRKPRGLAPRKAEQGNDAGPASEIDRHRPRTRTHVGRQQVGVGPEGQPVGALNETNMLVDFLPKLAVAQFHRSYRLSFKV